MVDVSFFCKFGYVFVMGNCVECSCDIFGFVVFECIV